MAFVNIKTAIKTKLGTIGTIQEVHDYPTKTFTGYPAAIVKIERNSSEFQTTIQNKRVYVVKIFIVQDLQQGASEMDTQKAYGIVEEVVDDIEEAFAKDERLTGTISLPSNEVMITCFPMLGVIDNDAEMVIAEIEMNVVLQFDITI